MSALTSDSLVSVIMPALDPDPTFFEQALRSLLGQTHAALEVLIVEVGSSPVLQTVPSRFGDRRLRRIVAPAPDLPAQRNLGLECAEGEVVAFLDADDVAAPSRFERQLGFLSDHPEVAVVGSQLVIIDPASNPIGSRRYPISHEAIHRGMSRANVIAGPAVTARRRVLVDAGGFRYDRFGGMAEDYELWSRLATSGVRFANIDEYLTFYRVHPKATKARRTRDHLRATVDIKTTYWSDRMGRVDRMRLLAERLLIHLPPGLVFRAFGMLYGKAPPGTKVPGIETGEPQQ